MQEVEDMIPDVHDVNLAAIDLDKARKEGVLRSIALEDMYVEHVEKSFDMPSIRNSGMNWGYDAMYGAGQRVMRT